MTGRRKYGRLRQGLKIRATLQNSVSLAVAFRDRPRADLTSREVFQPFVVKYSSYGDRPTLPTSKRIAADELPPSRRSECNSLNSLT